MTSFVICSSMRNLDEILRLKKQLEDNGHTVKTPSKTDTHKLPPEQALALQEELRPAHLLKIHSLPDTGVVLIINEKDGRIGYGTWTELSYAYALRCISGKQIRIMLLYSYSENTPGYEELAVFGLELFNIKEFKTSDFFCKGL